jgi:hypothetical protein
VVWGDRSETVGRLFEAILMRLSLQVRRDPTIVEISEAQRLDLERVARFTMTGRHRLWSLINAVGYLHEHRIEGDIVECGVWRGGSMMAAALELLRRSDLRDLWLFDTFSGMSEPTSVDRREGDEQESTESRWRREQDGAINRWCYAGIDDVRRNMHSTGYPAERVHFMPGRVEETLGVDRRLPDTIALLRLDTDWYESTLVELEVLYPRLVDRGVLIIDDYGEWQGARRAVDEYFGRQGRRPLLHYIDRTGRIAVKT